jgi:hypothetical protein
MKKLNEETTKYITDVDKARRIKLRTMLKEEVLFIRPTKPTEINKNENFNKYNFLLENGMSNNEYNNLSQSKKYNNMKDILQKNEEDDRVNIIKLSIQTEEVEKTL